MPPTDRLRRPALAGAVALLLALVTLGIAATPGRAATVWGIADQKPSTFANPAFLQLQERGMDTARYVLRYDALRYAHDRRRSFYAQQARDWLTAAHAANVEPLVTFWVTASGRLSLKRRIDPQRFLTEFRRFRRAYPWVRDFSLFNEPNLAGAYKRDPEALGRLYRLVRHELRDCRSCRLLGADLHGGATVGTYARRVEIGAGERIRTWGLNNYNDVNDGHSSDTVAFLRSPAVRSSKVWITEVGGVYSRKAVAEKDNPFLAQRRHARSDRARLRYQYDATRFMKRLVDAHPRQIQRAYIYQLQSTANLDWRPGARNGSWDSGLLDPAGNARDSFRYVLHHVL
jgi:hypothetical protein